MRSASRARGAGRVLALQGQGSCPLLSPNLHGYSYLSNFQELKEKAPFRGWGVGKRVHSGLSAMLSLWLAPVGRKIGRKRGAICRRLGISKRKPPLGGGGWACECVAVYPLRSRKGTSGTQGGGG